MTSPTDAPTPARQLQAEKAAARDKRRYVKVRPAGGGPWCICEPSEVQGLMDGEPPGEFEKVDVWMTDSEWEDLPEFEGW